MKKKILTFVVILSLLLSLFSIVASAEPEGYTEWELSANGKVLTKNSEEEFHRFELNEMFQLSDSLFVYHNEVYIEEEGFYTEVYASDKDADVVYLDYGDNVVAYCNKDGARELDKYLLGQSNVGKIFDFRTYSSVTVSSKLSKELLELTASGGYANVSYRELLRADSYDIELYSSDGCIYYVLGEVFHVDKNYYFVAYQGPLRAYKLTGELLTEFEGYLENLTPHNSNFTYESGDNLDFDWDLGFDSASAMAVLIILISVFGIALPIVFIIISIIKLFMQQVEYAMPYYVLFISSVIWCVIGIAGLIILII